ncbi:MAG: histidine kinase N-terminal domain-containing protein [Tessaracoccus sp.]
MVGDVQSMTDREWLEAFVQEWAILADLSFSDLVLWLAVDGSGERFRMRRADPPVTGPTALDDDVVRRSSV